jgi:type IV pilus assembly protein PilX
MRTPPNMLRAGAAPSRQQGAVLIVALLFLVILTILGLTAMQGTTMEERMSGNSRDINVALQAAEAALRDARRDINRLPISGAARASHVFGNAAGTPGTCNTADGAGLCRPLPPAYAGNSSDAIMPDPLIIDDQPAGTVATYGQFTGAPPLRATVRGTRNAPLAAQPRYLVELFCLPTRAVDSMGTQGVYCKFYRITAQGFGVNPNSRITLQEMFLSL